MSNSTVDKLTHAVPDSQINQRRPGEGDAQDAAGGGDSSETAKKMGFLQEQVTV